MRDAYKPQRREKCGCAIKTTIRHRATRPKRCEEAAINYSVMQEEKFKKDRRLSPPAMAIFLTGACDSERTRTGKTAAIAKDNARPKGPIELPFWRHQRRKLSEIL